MSIIQRRIPELEISEIIYGTLIGDNCLEIMEIPFLSKDLNYGDLVRCKPFMPDYVEGYYDFIEVIRFSGYTTIHVAFTQNVLLEEKKKIVSDLYQMGVLYRRAGLSSFAFSIGPGSNRRKAVEYIEHLIDTDVFC